MRATGFRIGGVFVAAVAFACGRSAPPPPPPASAPVAAHAPETVPPTLEEARALRTSGNFEAYERALRGLEDSADSQTSHRATALLALQAIDQNRPDEALPLLAKAAESYPEVAPWMRLRIALLHRDAGRYAEAAAVLSQVIERAPASAAAQTARLRLPAMQALAGDAAGVDTSFRQAMSIPIDALNEEEFCALADDLDNANRRDLAGRVRMRLLTEFPQGRLTEQTYDLASRGPDSPVDSLAGTDALSLAAKLGRNNRYDSEFDLLRRIAQRDRDLAESDSYRAIRIRALFGSRRYSELLSETDERSLRDPELKLLRARAAWRNDQPKVFLKGLARLERAFPKSSEAVEARVLRAKYYTVDEPKLDRAIDNLEQAVREGGPGAEGETLWTLGWTEYVARRYDEALQTFARYSREFPDGDYRVNALFWSAKIDELLGKTEERDAAFAALIDGYPYNYYSYRAREILGRPPAAAPETPEGSVFPDVEGLIAATHEPRLESVRELEWLGLNREAGGEMQSIAAAYPDNAGIAFMLADLYADGGEPFKAAGVLQRRFRPFIRHGGSGIPHRFWEILFPLKYWEAIRTEAQRRQVDPYLIASIIRQESGFEPGIVSNAGAVGIMQIMPKEAGLIAAAAGLEPPTRQQLFDPRINIALGVAEYAQKLSVMRGTSVLAIAAYNAGEDAVDRWLAQTPVDDLDLFVESIPYSETRLYVKSVTRTRFEYQRIYEGVASTLR